MAGAGGHEVERLAVKVVPDTGGFRKKLKAFLEKAEAESEIEVGLELKGEKKVKAKLDALAKDLVVKLKVELENVAEVRRQLATLVRDRAVNLHVDVDTNYVQAKLNNLARNRALSIDVDLKLDRARAALRLFLRDRRLRVFIDMDRDRFGTAFEQMEAMVTLLQGLSRNMMSMGRQAGNAMGQAFQQGTQGARGMSGAMGYLTIVVLPLLVAAIGILVGALIGLIIAAVGVVAALLAVVPVVGLVAAGAVYLFKSSDKQAKAFRKSLDEIKKTAKDTLAFAVQPMSKAIAKQVPLVDKWITSMTGPLRQAFLGASKYVDELADALMGFSSQALAGVANALKNPGMQKAIVGLKTLFEELGTGIGGFFETLAFGGADHGKTLAALGEALRKLLDQFAELGNAFATVSPEIISSLTEALSMLFETLKDPKTLAALAQFADFSFQAIAGFLMTIVLGIRVLIENWNRLVAITNSAATNIKAAWDGLVNWVRAKWSSLRQSVVSTASGMKAGVVGQWNSLVSSVQGIMGRFAGWISGIWARITGANRSGANNSKAAAIGPFNGLASAIAGVMGRIQGIVNGAWSVISGIVGRISGAISGAISRASQLKGLLDKVPFFAPAPDAPEDASKPTFRGDPPPAGGSASFKAFSMFDSVDQLSKLGSGLSTKYKAANTEGPTVSGNSDSLATKVYNFTTYAAPNEPVEKQFVKWMDYADTLYAA
ncbi:hypothetical protein [Spirillospora sp. NPDC047279]|uniref:phage tail protein n=1 Tax=Spirillospora sp. NPDC047279 TaxID=3155478 RepID=UPI0033FBD59E